MARRRAAIAGPLVAPATVTSGFVSAEQERQKAKELEDRQKVDQEIRELLNQLDARLDAIEEKLSRPPS